VVAAYQFNVDSVSALSAIATGTSPAKLFYTYWQRSVRRHYIITAAVLGEGKGETLYSQIYGFSKILTT
jgi:hypothetical protein